MRRPFALLLAALLANGCDGDSGATTDASVTGDGGDMGDGTTANPHTVKLTLPNRPNNAGMFSFVVAYQDGSGPWAVAPAPSGDTYSFPINAPSYGVAFTCIANVPGATTTQARSVTTAHFAVGERTEVALDVPARCSDRAAQNVTLSGTVSNRPSGGVMVVQWGARFSYVGSQTGNFTLYAPAGTHDLVVSHAVPEGNGDFYIDQVVVERNFAVTASSVHAIDFTAAHATQYFGVTINAGTDRAVAQTTLYTANGTTTNLVREAANWETQSLAASQMVATDVYDQSIAVTRLGSSATITNATDAPAAQTWVAPAPLGAATATTITKMPYVMLETSWPSYADVTGYSWNATQQPTTQQCGGTVPCTILWSSYVSPGVVGTMPGYAMPDLSALTGWKPALGLVDGAPVIGSVTAFISSVGAQDFPPRTPANGTKRTYVRSDFSVTP